MTLGIDFRVNTAPVIDAKKIILDTSKALEELAGHSDIQLDVNTGEFAVLSRSMTDTMRKLETMSSRISASGGQKTIAQEQEAARLLQRQKTDAEAYERALQKIGTQLDSLYERKRKLERTEFVVGSDEQLKAKEELDRINKELETKTAAYEKIQSRYDPRTDRALRRSAAAGEEIADYETRPEDQKGINWWSYGKKGFLIGAGILGIRGAFGTARDAKEEAREYDIANANLFMRGGGRLTPEWSLDVAAKSGYKPMEQIAIVDQLNKTIGLRDEHLFTLARSLMSAEVRSGMSSGTYANYLSTTFPAVRDVNPIFRERGSGAGTSTLASAIGMLRDSAIAMNAGGRLPEILETNAKLLTDIVGARGGKELSFNERDQLIMMQMALWSTPGQMGKGMSGVNLIEKIDQGIRSGGNSQGMQALIAQALGIENVATREDLWNYKKRQAEGASVRNVVAVLEASERFARISGISDRDAEVGMKENLTGLGLNPFQAEKLTDPRLRKLLHQLIGKSGSLDVFKAITMTDEGKKYLGEDEWRVGRDFEGLEGTKTRRAEATAGSAVLEPGRDIQTLATTIKQAIVDGYATLKEMWHDPTGQRYWDGSQTPAQERPAPLLSPRYHGMPGEN